LSHDVWDRIIVWDNRIFLLGPRPKLGSYHIPKDILDVNLKLLTIEWRKIEALWYDSKKKHVVLGKSITHDALTSSYTQK
jgi:hypothetical protein